MIRVPRLALTLITLGFGLYHAFLGLIYLDQYEERLPAVLALVLYTGILGITIGWSSGLRIPNWLAWINIVSVVAISILMVLALGDEYELSYTTWHVSGVATIMAITMVRGHSVLPWIGVVFMVVEILMWGGPGTIFTAGIIGALLLLVAAQAANYALTASTKAANEFRIQSLETRAAAAASAAAVREREIRVSNALKGSLPMLELIVASSGRLSMTEKKASRLAEAGLRDQIRGRMLVSKNLVHEIHEARSRGVEVQLLDDGGMDELGEAERNQLLDKAAAELSNIQSGKVVIRSVAGENWKLTIAAIRKDTDRPDLFLRL